MWTLKKTVIHTASGPETLQGVSWRSDGSIHLPSRPHPLHAKRDTEERAPLLDESNSPDNDEEDNVSTCIYDRRAEVRKIGWSPTLAYHIITCVNCIVHSLILCVSQP